MRPTPSHREPYEPYSTHRVPQADHHSQRATDTVVDKIDTEIETHRKRIQLSHERIAVAEQATREEEQQAEQDRLDAIAALADQARKAGEALLPEYAGTATKLTGILTKLAAIDGLITESNRTLRNAGRPVIASPNAVRCRVRSQVERTERRRLGVGDAQHPMASLAAYDRNGNCYRKDTNEHIEPFGDFDVSVKEVIPAIINAPLQDEVRLPSATVEGAAIWPRTAIDHAAVLKELGLTDTPSSALKRLLSKAVA